MMSHTYPASLLENGPASYDIGVLLLLLRKM
jgi:hypothetical protein